MTITLVQSNGSNSSGTLNATPPAWGTTTTVGNLLVLIGTEANGTNQTWPTVPAGYTAFASNVFIFNSAGVGGVIGGFWKIAAGADATPGNYGESTGTQDWVTYTYEFSAPGGWLSSAADVESHTPVTANVTATTKTAVTTATLAQASELALAVVAGSTASTALGFTSNVYATAQPATNNGKLWGGWVETVATTAQTTIATWTTAVCACVKLVTFKTAAAPVASAVNALDWTAPGRQH